MGSIGQLKKTHTKMAGEYWSFLSLRERGLGLLDML